MTKHDLMHNLQLSDKQAAILHHDLRQKSNADINSYPFITLFDEHYPQQLKEIYDPPPILFYQGDLSLLHEEKSIAVVGARSPSNQAFPVMKKILIPLIQKGWCIVSGLAYGVDAYSHQLALEKHGKTIAILGSGLESIYPKAHQNLAKSIASRGLLISEFLPKQPPAKWQFPLRNRLISGITKGTLVVEAKERSGSLITADQALEQGREVFAIPGSILNLNSQGTNRLIQEGAKMVLSSNDIENEILFDKR